MTISPQKKMQQAIALLNRCERPLLIAHPRPDGDTIGCTLALRLALLALGKQPTVACVHPIGETFAYLPGADAFVRKVAEDADHDLVVAVDMSDLDRAGGLYYESWRERMPLLVVDHHATNDAFGDVNVVAPEAAATALPLTKLIEGLGVPVRDEIATCLLVAVLTDTRGLRTESTTPEVLAFVADLIEAGGNYQRVMQKTLDAVAYRKMRGWGVALNRLQLEGQVAWTTFPLAEKEQLGIDDHYDLDLGNLLSRVAEAKIIASFLEMRDDSVKVSLRARPGYDVAWIAKELGGGGHRLAAGCSVPDRWIGTGGGVLALIREELARQRAQRQAVTLASP